MRVRPGLAKGLARVSVRAGQGLENIWLRLLIRVQVKV